MTLQVCSTPGCPNLKPCADHLTRDIRGSSTERGYDAQWQRDRALHLRREPRCRDCDALATDADHIVPMRVAGRLVHQLAACPSRCGIASRCRGCHRRKTLRDARLYPTGVGGYESSSDKRRVDLRLGRNRGVRVGTSGTGSSLSRTGSASAVAI